MRRDAGNHRDRLKLACTAAETTKTWKLRIQQVQLIHAMQTTNVIKRNEAPVPN